VTLLRLLFGLAALGAVFAGDVWQAVGLAAVVAAIGLWPHELRRR
jgi:hypothetical protein